MTKVVKFKTAYGDRKRQGFDQETGEIEYDLDSQYATMSRRAGIGESWYWKYGWTDAHRHDYIVPWYFHSYVIVDYIIVTVCVTPTIFPIPCFSLQSFRSLREPC